MSPYCVENGDRKIVGTTDALPFSLLLQASMTLAPLLARSLAASSPIPALAPVTTTTCEANYKLCGKK